MIAFPAGFDLAQVAADLFTVATPIFELLFIGFAAAVVVSALRKGGKGL